MHCQHDVTLPHTSMIDDEQTQCMSSCTWLLQGSALPELEGEDPSPSRHSGAHSNKRPASSSSAGDAAELCSSERPAKMARLQPQQEESTALLAAANSVEQAAAANSTAVGPPLQPAELAVQPCLPAGAVRSAPSCSQALAPTASAAASAQAVAAAASPTAASAGAARQGGDLQAVYQLLGVRSKQQLQEDRFSMDSLLLQLGISDEERMLLQQ